VEGQRQAELRNHAIIQVHAVRGVRWRGAFALHTYIVMKSSGSQQVLGVGIASGDPRATNRTGPDNYSFALPVLVLDCRGADCDVPIEKIAMTW
jgi:hypothetical protein